VSTKDTGKGYKTLAIRLDDDIHAQLQVIARLQESSIAAEIQHAIAAHLDTKRSDPELSARATSVLEDIEREATVRQQAIADLFTGSTGASGTKSTRAKGRSTAKADDNS
jgi:predicted transcriptional regulator